MQGIKQLAIQWKQYFTISTEFYLLDPFSAVHTSLIQSVVSYSSLFHSNMLSFNINGSAALNKLLADPDLEYFHGRHIPLALVAIVFGLLILAYTLALLFICPLQRYSHLLCFTWVAKLKPLRDAYTANFPQCP